MRLPDRFVPLAAAVSAAWPHLRAILIALHLVAIVALSLPRPGSLLNERAWQSRNTQTEMVRWSSVLRSVGITQSPEALAHNLRALATRYAGVYHTIIAPFRRYERLSQARQGWQMFATPQKSPAELHIDMREGPSQPWLPLYRPHSEVHDAWRNRLTHNRLRKLQGRFARSFRPDTYDALARFIAGHMARDYPEASDIRIRLGRYDTLPPERVRAGQRPVMRYEHERIFIAQELR